MTATGRSEAPLRLQPLGGRQEITLAAPRLIVAGYTGRDAEAVAAHIAELEAIGVPPPPAVPTFYDLDPALLTTDRVIETAAAVSSGEVEPVLIRHAGDFYLGVGSDHTDRNLERTDICSAKAACPKPLGRAVISLPAGLDSLDWDGITVESQVDGVDYQRASLSTLRTPDDLLGHLGRWFGPIDTDLVVFAGTVPLIDGRFIAGAHWALTLTAAGGRLTHSYQLKRRYP